MENRNSGQAVTPNIDMENISRLSTTHAKLICQVQVGHVQAEEEALGLYNYPADKP